MFQTACRREAANPQLALGDMEEPPTGQDRVSSVSVLAIEGSSLSPIRTLSCVFDAILLPLSIVHEL